MSKLFNIKVLVIIAFTIFIILFCRTDVEAANVSINCESSVEVNSPITINVTGTGVQWGLRLIVDGKVIASSYETVNYKSNIGISFSGTYTPTSTGKKTIKLEGSVTEYSDGSTITDFKSKEITVKEKSNTGGENNNSNNNNIGNNDDKNNTNNNNNSDNNEEPPSENKPVTSNLSQDNTLKALSVDVGTLTPKFSPRTTKYTIDVGEDVTNIKISATKNNSKAKVSGAGTKKLNPGANTFEIEVKAENGWTQIYTIVVNKPQEQPKEPELKLSALIVKGINTNRELNNLIYKPEFSEDVYIYNIDVEEDIESLSIEAIPKEEGTIVEILGNEDLVAGENVVNIIVKSAEGEKTATYQIIVNKKQPIQQASAIIEKIPEDVEENKSLLSQYCIPIVVFTATVAVLGLIFAIIEYKHSIKEKVPQTNEFNNRISIENETFNTQNVDNFIENGENNTEKIEMLEIPEMQRTETIESYEENYESQRIPETMELTRRDEERKLKRKGKGKHF